MTQTNAKQTATKNQAPVAKILVIEDETLLREEVIEWLTFEGYASAGVADGVSGVEYAIRQLPDLIICDITMPRLDGYGVLLEVRSNPSTAGIPFIFVTARASYEDVRMGMNQGADDYITKPFTRLELLKAIQTRLQKKQLQEQERQNQVAQLQQILDLEHERRLLKTKLVAMFSHDFRGPLSSILLTNSLLRDYGSHLSDDRRLTHINHIEASARLLLQMLDDILVIAQIENDSLEFKAEPTDVNVFLQQIVDDNRLIYGARRPIQFIASGVGLVMVDPRLLRQIITNLLSNALKYSARDSVVSITLTYEQGACHFQIHDQGIGIPDGDMVYLFEPFQRGSNVATITGTGLGLAIVKQAVDLHGGTLAIDSQLDVGTKVTVTIPAPQEHSVIGLTPEVPKSTVTAQRTPTPL